jgi:hypothetical protein
MPLGRKTADPFLRDPISTVSSWPAVRRRLTMRRNRNFR